MKKILPFDDDPIIKSYPHYSFMCSMACISFSVSSRLIHSLNKNKGNPDSPPFQVTLCYSILCMRYRIPTSFTCAFY